MKEKTMPAPIEEIAVEKELSSAMGNLTAADGVKAPVPAANTLRLREWLTRDDRSSRRENRPTFADCFSKPYFAQWQTKREKFGLTFYEALLFFGWACDKLDLLALAELIELNIRISTAAQYDKFLEARHESRLPRDGFGIDEFGIDILADYEQSPTCKVL
jgi:hypothetical protein